MPIPDDNLLAIQKECVELDDDVRWLVALISDTGMRLAEAAGLLVSDIHLDADIPKIALRKHPWRSLKTNGSERDMPLAGMSLWAARHIVLSQQDFAFPGYMDSSGCNANAASAAINKWLKPRVPTDVWFTASATAFETGSVVLNARQISLMPSAVGLP